MNKLIAALIAGAFAFAATATLAQDKTPEPSVKAPTKAERAAAKEAKMNATPATKAEKRAKNQQKLKDTAAVSKQGDQTPEPMSNTAKGSGPAKPSRAERQQDAKTMQQNAGKAGQ